MFVTRLLSRLITKQRERDAMSRLLSMSDHQLEDIGLRRSEIEDAIRHGFQAR